MASMDPTIRFLRSPQVNRLEHDEDHDQTGRRDGGGPDGSQQRSQHHHALLPQGKIEAHHLCDEQRARALVECGAVHVDRGPHRQDE